MIFNASFINLLEWLLPTSHVEMTFKFDVGPSPLFGPAPRQSNTGDNVNLDIKVQPRDPWNRAQSLPLPGKSRLDLRRQSTPSLPHEARVETPLHIQTTTPNLVKEGHTQVDIIPKTPEMNISLEFPDAKFPQSNRQVYFIQTTSDARGRKDSIVDDMPEPGWSRRLERKENTRRIGQSSMILCTPQKRRYGVAKSPFERSSEKKFNEVPSSAPRLVMTKGRYTFRRGVRTRDYNIPPTKAPAPGPWSSAYQCRDRFDRDEVPALGPLPISRRRSPRTGLGRGVRRGSMEDIPMTLRGSPKPYRMFGPGSPPNGDSGSSMAVESSEIKQEADERFEKWLAREADLPGESLMENLD